MKHVMYIQIMGHDYPIEANSGDDLYVNRLAQFVEERMKEIKEESSHSKDFESKASELIQMLDTALASK